MLVFPSSIPRMVAQEASDIYVVAPETIDTNLGKMTT